MLLPLLLSARHRTQNGCTARWDATPRAAGSSTRTLAALKRTCRCGGFMQNPLPAERCAKCTSCTCCVAVPLTLCPCCWFTPLEPLVLPCTSCPLRKYGAGVPDVL